LLLVAAEQPEVHNSASRPGTGPQPTCGSCDAHPCVWHDTHDAAAVGEPQHSLLLVHVLWKLDNKTADAAAVVRVVQLGTRQAGGAHKRAAAAAAAAAGAANGEARVVVVDSCCGDRG
jgi:hypothetical protein